MITPTSSNEDFLNSIDTNVFTNLINNNDIINELQIAEINKKIIKSLDEYKREYQEKLEKDIWEFEEYKKEKTEELNNLIEISTQLTAKIKENERLLEIEKTKFKLFSSERKLNKIIEEGKNQIEEYYDEMPVDKTVEIYENSVHKLLQSIVEEIDKENKWRGSIQAYDLTNPVDSAQFGTDYTLNSLKAKLKANIKE
jgi:hypothetical protein